MSSGNSDTSKTPVKKVPTTLSQLRHGQLVPSKGSPDTVFYRPNNDLIPSAANSDNTTDGRGVYLEAQVVLTPVVRSGRLANQNRRALTSQDVQEMTDLFHKILSVRDDDEEEAKRDTDDDDNDADQANDDTPDEAESSTTSNAATTPNTVRFQEPPVQQPEEEEGERLGRIPSSMVSHKTRQTMFVLRSARLDY